MYHPGATVEFPLGPGPGDLTDIYITTRIDSYGVRRQEERCILVSASLVGKAGQRLAVNRKDTHPLAEFADVDDVVFIDFHVGRSQYILPLLQEFAVGIENLQPAVFAVGNPDPPLIIQRNKMGHPEMTGCVARLTPGKKQFTLRGKLVHAGITVAIGDVEVSGVGNRHTGGTVKGRSAVSYRVQAPEYIVPLRDVAGVRGLSFVADSLQQFPFLGEFVDDMEMVIGTVD